MNSEADDEAGQATSARNTPSGCFIPPEPAELSALLPQLEILELLGHGGMGAVYKARQPGLDRLVAVKILPPDISHTAGFAERFAREARALARLSHPNIVGVYDSGHVGELYFFVMEYIDGVNLRQAMQGGKLTPEEAIAIVPQICDALQFAHDEGVVHRDIKPENVLVDSKSRVKIADFGLAKLLRYEPTDLTLTQSHQVMGTPRYMAPEQMTASHSVDHRADIYSLGVVFYELLTGEVPMGRFEPPSQRVKIDVRLDEVVLRALDREPDKRYQQASAIRSDVESISTSRILAPAATQTQQLPEQTELPTATDGLVFRRLTWIVVGFWILWAGLWAFDLYSYVSGAAWYFADGIPKQPWNTVLFAVSGVLAYFVVYWWYVLAKSPDTPRSFGDFARTMQTPDRRIRWLLIPAGIFAVLAAAAVTTSTAYANDAAQAAVVYGLLIVAAPIFLALCASVYGRPRDEAGPAREADNSESNATPWSGKPLAQMRFLVDEPADVSAQAIFHFSSLGYQVVAEQPAVIVFQRGRKWGGLHETDIRGLHTRLTVRTATAEQGKKWVSCDWSVHTLGSWVSQGDRKQLEQEGHDFAKMLAGTSGGANTSCESVQTSSGGLAEEMENKQQAIWSERKSAEQEVIVPAIGLIIVGILTLLATPLWVLTAASVWAVTPIESRNARSGSPEIRHVDHTSPQPEMDIEWIPERPVKSLDVLGGRDSGILVPIHRHLTDNTPQVVGPLAQNPPVSRQVTRGASPSLFMLMLGSLVVVGLPSLVVGSVIIVGGWRMLKLRSHGLAIVASILALIPCDPFFFLGLIFGIWSLVILCRPHVKAAF